MNDIEDWLNALGLDSPTGETPEETTANVPAPLEEAPYEAPYREIELATPVSMSPDEFNDILAENGFQEPEYDEAEEISEEEEEEESTDEYSENGDEGRDLDAEEDRDWRSVLPRLDQEVYIPMPNRDVIDVPIIREDAIQAVQAVNEDYPEHNPDEEVSQDAMEAFSAVAEQQESSAEELPLPPNSPTLLVNNATSRFSGTEWYNEIQKSRIILAGLGGIGSWTALQLARMNPAAISMYDDDVVEQANMSGQLYRHNDVGKAKVDAMTDMIHDYTTMHSIYAIKDKFTENCEAGDIMICGFDNMVARRNFFDAWHDHMLHYPTGEERAKCLFIDGRLSISALQVFCITGDNDWAISEYAGKYLFSDAEAEETVCSMKQTTYLACMIGSFIVNLFTNWVANSLNPVIPYDLPFFTEYDAQNMIFKTIK